MRYSFPLLVVGLGFLSSVICQIPCDDAYGANCPEASGWEVSTCLKAVDQSTLSAECVKYVNLHDSCRSDIDAHCTGKEFTGDLLVCLTEWTKPELLSAECKSALPSKEKKEKVLSDKEKKKAEARRKTRKAAEKLARTQGSKKSTDTSAKNAKNAKKSKKVVEDDDDYEDDL